MGCKYNALGRVCNAKIVNNTTNEYIDNVKKGMIFSVNRMNLAVNGMLEWLADVTRWKGKWFNASNE